jgi:hypothetical protein
MQITQRDLKRKAKRFAKMSDKIKILPKQKFAFLLF